MFTSSNRKSEKAIPHLSATVARLKGWRIHPETGVSRNLQGFSLITPETGVFTPTWLLISIPKPLIPDFSPASFQTLAGKVSGVSFLAQKHAHALYV
ncbi:hypothetical protein CEXT_697011 [Caerostris extrusa]|uniref:Uncharacterized protein n=1 Tax=Caerostris extrusa TaxID=172846 RepID=A0AAV4YAL3_CAEEX|nr:hypothetical protein CEXT_697011 [Caerostris extrusa]